MYFQNESEIELLPLTNEHSQGRIPTPAYGVLRFLARRQVQKRLWRGFRLITITIALLFTLFYCLPHYAQVYLASQPFNAYCGPNGIPIDTSCRHSHADNTTEIPNILHLVFVVKDARKDEIRFQFSHFMALYAARRHWHPDTVYLHTNIDTSSTVFDKARSGELGKWTKEFFNVPELVINTVTAPTHAGNGQPLRHLEHQSDFVRVQAVHDFGGVYIDLDVHTLQDLTVLRQSGYAAVGGMQVDSVLNSGTFMARKGSSLTRLWLDSMNELYDGKWTTHSNDALTKVAKRLKATPCEILVLPKAAFAPMGYRWADKDRLYDNYYDGTDIHIVKGNNSQNDTLAHFWEDDARVRDHARFSWTPDWSCSYLLHAFSSRKLRDGVTDNGLSPQFIASRQSNFALYLYPTLQAMFEEGIVDKADLGL